MSHSPNVKGPALLPLTSAAGCRFLGKAYFLSCDTTQAEVSYREAISVTRDALPAWKGLAEIYVGPRSIQREAMEVFEQLVRLSSQRTGVAAPA